MEDKTPRGAYRSRQNVRRIAQEIVVELTTQWPGTSVTVDLDGVDGEDAFLWISPGDSDSRDRVALTALKLVNSLGARMGFWIVPRVLNQSEEKEETSHRLRLVRSEEQPFSDGNWPTDSGDNRNALQRN